MNKTFNHQQTIDISFIIVSWNTKAFLLQCLQSIVENTQNFEIEIIVVDNASSDGSVLAVEQNYPFVKIIKNTENEGFARANNIGIQNSLGKFICLLNSDVIIFQNTVQCLINYLEENPGVGLIAPKALNADRSIQKNAWKFPSPKTMLTRALALDTIFPAVNYYSADKIKQVDVLSGCFWLSTREAIKKVGLLDERFFIYYEDNDWCYRFRQSGYKVIYYPNAEIIHYGGASSNNAPVKFFIEMLIACDQFFSKHYGLISQKALKFLFFIKFIIRLVGFGFLYISNINRNESNKTKIAHNFAGLKWLFGFKLYY